jgi:hypothetical protein
MLDAASVVYRPVTSKVRANRRFMRFFWFITGYWGMDNESGYARSRGAEGGSSKSSTSMQGRRSSPFCRCHWSIVWSTMAAACLRRAGSRSPGTAKRPSSNSLYSGSFYSVISRAIR